jgi:serine/threonine-protein kinase
MRALSRAETEPWQREFGPYAVHELLAERGLATVHRATCDGHEIALKRLHARFAGDWELVDAFLYEAQLARQLNHPHIARTYALGKHDGTFYAANELVRGAPLDAIVRQSRRAAGAIPVHVVIEVLAQLCEVLEHLHATTPRIVLRGLAPETVMIARDGRVKLMGLPFARLGVRRSHYHGALAYISPEAVAGEIDARGDLFALGAIAHELLVGRPLFAGASEVATVHNVCTRIVARPSRSAGGISRELDDIVLTALQRDPDRRWQSAGVMARALRRVAREHGERAQLVHEVADWLAWAFARKPRRDSTKVVRMLDSIERAYEA